MIGDLDVATFRSLATGPDTDTRAWVSYGLVDADTAQARSVLFNDEDGNPLPWPTVLVTLQPSGVQVPCRVASTQSGTGEGHWRPFVAGDEVLVAIPMGDEREGCVIIGRMTQGRDAFPAMVAGNDMTQNTTAFDRFIPPYILESGTAIMLRLPSVGAFIALDPTGNATVNNSDGHYLALHHDLLSITTADTSCMMQIDPSKQQVYLQGGGTSLLLDSGGASNFLSGGQLSIVTAGGGYLPGNAITLQEAVALIEGFMTVWSSALGLIAAPLTGTSLAATINPGTLPGLTALGITAGASLPLTVEPVAITAALQVPPDPTGTIPGVGRPGFLY